MEQYSNEEARLANILNFVALGGIILSIAGLFGPYLGPSASFFAEPFSVVNTVSGLSLLAVLSWIAANDVRRFRSMIYILIVSLVLGAVVFILFLVASPWQNQGISLLLGAILFGAVAVLIGFALSQAKSSAAIWSPWLTEKPLTRIEGVGRVVFALLGVFWLLTASVFLLLSVAKSADFLTFFHQSTLIVGSVFYFVLLGICALFAARAIRNSGVLNTVLIAAHVVGLMASGVALLGIAHFGTASASLFGLTLTPQQIMMALLLLNPVIAVALFVLQSVMDHAVLDYLGFFSPLQFRALEAISETLIEGGASRMVPPYQIALRTDRYLSSFPSNRLWLAKLAVLGVNFAPLIVLEPPLNFANPAKRREFIDRYFKRDIVNDRGIYWVLDRPLFRRLIDFIEGGMRFNMQLSFMGYYSDLTVHQKIGYVPFSERSQGFSDDVKKGLKPVRKYPPLQVMTPGDFRHQGIDSISSADVVVIGSGAGGSILAEQLAEKYDVLLVEKGQYTRPDDFTEDEIDMISHLYADGALQISQALRFTVLQGNCVGGSTVVNNAVCFNTPDEVLTHWNDAGGLNAGIEVDFYRKSQQAVRDRMSIKSVLDSTVTRQPAEIVLNPGDGVISKGVANYLAQGSYEYNVVDANIANCLGCGYCNIGCKYGRKLSMLDEVLPAAQKAHPDTFRIISEAQAVRLNGHGGIINEVVLQFRDKRQLTIRNPKTVIVSAGTIASSWLLMRSGIGKGELPIGRHLCFNMGSPLHGYWDELKLDSYAGLQIAHYLKLAEKTGFVFETWYNPPVAQSLTMPGWLETHFNNMLHYDHMAAVGILVGSETNAYLTPALILRGSPDIVYEPTSGDLDKLLDALTTMGNIMFAGGAKEVYANTRSYRSYKQGQAIYKSPNDLSNLHTLVKESRDIFLGTGHPQGGNAISKNRGKDGLNGGVIGPDFKVYGYTNLYVCDASVHPSATTVNPQLTVMTMAHYMARYASGLLA